MNPTYQTNLDGKNGNCIQAVLASLLHLPIEDIPVFPNPDTWIIDLNRWLRQFHLGYLPLTDFRDWRESLGLKACFHEVAGPSPADDSVFHACVGLDGDVVFDPFPGAEGLQRVHSCGVFVILQPWRLLEMRAQIAMLAKALECLVGASSISELKGMKAALQLMIQDDDVAHAVDAVQALLDLRTGMVPSQPPADQAYLDDRRISAFQDCAIEVSTHEPR
jgi:hypothetical protein